MFILTTDAILLRVPKPRASSVNTLATENERSFFLARVQDAGILRRFDVSYDLASQATGCDRIARNLPRLAHRDTLCRPIQQASTTVRTEST